MSTVDTTDGLLDSNAISPTDKNGRPIPVTIPVMLAPASGWCTPRAWAGVSQGDAAGLNLGGKNGDDPKHVAANRAALADEIDARLSLVSQIHSGTAIDMDETYAPNRDYGFDATGGALPDGGEPEATVIEADAQVTTPARRRPRRLRRRLPAGAAGRRRSRRDRRGPLRPPRPAAGRDRRNRTDDDRQGRQRRAHGGHARTVHLR